MIAEILSTGDEIRSGSLIDSNSAYIAQKLEEIGLEIVRHSCVGDSVENISGILLEIGERADIAVVTGGLGPTVDDLSAVAAARAAHVPVEYSASAMQSIEAFFKNRNYPVSSSCKKQAMLPRGSECLMNPVGTAPGFLIKIGKCDFYFLPGVPFEMRRMLEDQVKPRILKTKGDKETCLVKTISTFGLTESVTGERIEEAVNMFSEIKVGLRAKFPEIQVKLYGRSGHEDTLEKNMAIVEKHVREKLGRKIFSFEGEAMEAVVGQLLRQKGASLALAESCTGGLIASRLTEVSGSSDYFLFSGVTYSNAAKVKVLGVSENTLLKYGAVHEKTAAEMAVGVQKIAGATYGLSTTGIAGPGGGTREKPVGTVCIGLATPEKVITGQYHFPFGRRWMNKSVFAMKAMDLLRRELL
ncbi:MAG: competence/damage-inducible protein A [Deltaproteobacteria bacterium]|nr:MAG: competence/damage-inducible protein A [Deltaproteobacteria bacterium]